MRHEKWCTINCDERINSANTKFQRINCLNKQNNSVKIKNRFKNVLIMRETSQTLVEFQGRKQIRFAGRTFECQQRLNQRSSFNSTVIDQQDNQVLQWCFGRHYDGVKCKKCEIKMDVASCTFIAKLRAKSGKFKFVGTLKTHS